MDWRIVLSPVVVTGVLAAIVALVLWGQPRSREGWQTRPLLWGVALVVLLGMVASSLGVGPAEWISGSVVRQVAGIVVLAVAGIVAFIATRQRRRADVLVASAPVQLDEAVARVRDGTGRMVGVFKGRISSDEEVTSPGGIVCSFFQAELRSARADGKRGALLSSDQGAPQTLWLRGERVQAMIPFSLESAFAPEQIRKCVLGSQLADGPMLADGVPPMEAVSWEKLGRKGEACLVVGELRPGPAKGSYLLSGTNGGAAVLVLSSDTNDVAKRLVRRAWTQFAAAGALCCFAAWLLAV